MLGYTTLNKNYAVSILYTIYTIMHYNAYKLRLTLKPTYDELMKMIYLPADA